MDHRRYPRAGADLRISWKRHSDADLQPASAHDLSASGLSFPDADLQTRDTVSLRIEIENPKLVIESPARVVRVFEKSGERLVAVEFAGIAYEDFITLLDYSLARYDAESP